MRSMTGYGHSVYRDEKYTIELEIKSYNNRFLDISHSINPQLSSFENYVDERVKKVARRGHLDISLRLKVLKNEALLSLEIVNSIKNQLSEWHFDSSDGDGHGRFNYSIIKK